MHKPNPMRFVSTLLAIVSFMACTEEAPHGEDFTDEGLFSAGIEGPASDATGNIYAVNFAREGTIGIVTPEGEVSLFAELPEGSIGNGIRFDRDGNMFIADYARHNILRISAGTREAEVFAHDSTMNQPNDLAIAPNGTLYASDPKWDDNTGQLWMARPSGELIRLEADMGTTNGIEVSPEGDLLYVNESIQRKVWVYDILADGTVAHKRLFAKFPDHGLDGMRCDGKGNLYITRFGKGTVVIFSPKGEQLLEIPLTGQRPTNIAFGGKDGKTCFVTLADRGCIETFQALYPGRSFAMWR